MTDSTPHSSELPATGPAVGQDEWVARHGERRSRRAGLVGQAEERLRTVPWWGWLILFVAVFALLPAGGDVLDIGCGGAEPMAGYLIGKGFAVTGVDSAPAMIALCRERHPGQQWMVHDMRTLALGRRFDGILAAPPEILAMTPL